MMRLGVETKIKPTQASTRWRSVHTSLPMSYVIPSCHWLARTVNTPIQRELILSIRKMI